MSRRSFAVLACGLLAAVAVSVIAGQNDAAKPKQAQGGGPPAASAAEEPRDADRQAIRQSSRAFSAAFDKHDAKAVAAFWTEQGEYQEESGEVVRGRPAIEKAFAEFFKENPRTSVEVRIDSIHFPARDLAIEEGILRQSGGPADLPSSTFYSVIHVREGGEWKIAISREWSGGHDRLDDLEWLLGRWQGGLKDHEISLSFEKDPKGPFVLGRFVKKVAGKTTASGSMKIGFDAQRGRLHSWHFDDDGGHGESLWVRDGHRWVMDAIGVSPSGAEHAAVNVLTRIGPDEFTWRSIDRVSGDEALPDTLPVKLTRVTAGK